MASVGDCQTGEFLAISLNTTYVAHSLVVLCTKSSASVKWDARLLTANHNGTDPVELQKRRGSVLSALESLIVCPMAGF